MRGTGGLAGLVIVLGIGYYLYSEQVGGSSEKKRPAVEQIDIAGVRSDLLSLAQAERYYMAGHGTYATLEQLRKSPPIANLPGGPRRGYSYDLQVEGARHFLITARPADGADLPVLSIDETMTLE